MKLQNETLIKRWEELRLEAYLPTPNDKWTIGWGHTSGVKEGMRITKKQAEKFFDEDVQWAEDTVNELVRVGLNQYQFDALVSFVFNIGRTQFQRSTLLRKLNAGNYEGASEEFPKWKYQDGKVLRGLVRRRQDEMEYFLKSEMVENNAGNMKPDENESMKSLMKSKEVWGGLSAALTGVGTLLGGLGAQAQNILSVGLTVALIGFGAFFVWNRVRARNKGER